ncbi:cyclase family protein [Flavobacterium sp. SM15]|uniref:cyclase family protein n=1 Tax=Flavobacterium sp. SM15 TaxID=2908005 RepID=UPI001EDBDB22|nr:cyclase family protein [Flavobacterium sp. SM15]MCG2611902.1 cyclase family protein [Flavobacterium sp. SM15]
MKHFIYFSLLLGLCSCARSEKKQTLSEVLATGKWIDLTYDFSQATIYWPNNPTGFKLNTQFNGITSGGFFYASNEFCAPEHGGTHLDAPIHFAKGKWSTEQIPLEQLNGTAILVDISAKSKINPDYQISITDVEAWEKSNGTIPRGSFLLFRTGWGKFYPDKSKYLGTAIKGDAAIPHLHFPGIDPILSEWLVKNRKIKAVGIDTPSIDYGQSKEFKTHQILCGENILGFENLANLQELPETGIYIIALPMKIKNGTGGPLRIIAWVGNTEK